MLRFQLLKRLSSTSPSSKFQSDLRFFLSETYKSDDPKNIKFSKIISKTLSKGEQYKNQLNYFKVLGYHRFQNIEIHCLNNAFDFSELFDSPMEADKHIENLFQSINNELPLENEDLTKICATVPEFFTYNGDDFKHRMNHLRNREIFPLFRKDFKHIIKRSPYVWLVEPINDVSAKIEYILKTMAVGILHTTRHHTDKKDSQVKWLIHSKILDLPYVKFFQKITTRC